MRRHAFVYDELVGRHPYDLAVAPFDHWQTEAFVNPDGVVYGFAHRSFDGQLFRVESGQLVIVIRDGCHGRS